MNTLESKSTKKKTIHFEDPWKLIDYKELIAFAWKG